MISFYFRALPALVLLWSIITQANGQSADTFYYDFAGKKTIHKNVATQFTVGKQKGNLYVVSKYMINGTPTLTGSYTGDGKKEGYFKHYHNNGLVEKEGSYAKDWMTGEWTFYYQDGKTVKVKKLLYDDGLVEYVEHYDSTTGKKYAEGTCMIEQKDGKQWEFRTGVWTIKYEGSDRVFKVVDYKQGRMTGGCKYYDSASTNLLSEGQLINGNRTGRWKFYNTRTKKLIIEQDYVNHKYHGVFIRYDSVKSMKKIVGQHVNDKHEGEWLFYFPGTTKIAGRTMYKNGKKEGEEVEYDSLTGLTTLMGLNTNGKRTGLWTFYFAGTTRMQSQVNYKNGYYDGVAILYDSLTGLKTAEGRYDHGKISGKWKHYYPGSEVVKMEKSFKDGMLDGTLNEYDSTGFKCSSLEYKDGKRHGDWRMFFNDVKTKWVHARFDNDVLDGKLETYYADGKKRRIENYDKGKQLSGKCLLQDGVETAYYPFVIEPDYMLDVMNYIANNVRYPLGAEDERVEGEVLVGFVVDEHGKVKNVEVTKGLGNGFDEEAVRVIANMRTWKPMYIDGLPVASYLQTQVRFATPGANDRSLREPVKEQEKDM